MENLTVLYKESNVFYNILCFLITENEKLFDRSDAKLYWRTVLHVLALYHYAVVGLFAKDLELGLKESQNEELYMLYRFRVAYLTGWNVLFQTTFLFLALAHDALEWSSKQDSTVGQKIRYWRDVIFSALVVPYTCFVFTMFWSLYTIDRELVFPKVYDAVVPWWFNHCVHTNILAMVVVETVLQPRRQPVNRKLELMMDGAVGILYAIVYYSIYFFAGRWLYNVFGIMTWWQVCLFQLVIWFSSYVFYEMQWPINRLIHGKGPEAEQEKEVTSTENGFQNGRTLNGEMRQTNDVQEIGEEKPMNGDVKQNGGAKQDGGAPQNGVQAKNVDFKAPPFSTRSWSLKYRTIRNQFENSKL
ncbi:hypothetical protein O0L34_g13314 [Tuta absoluta]|nr:hypothetical protein O0L34_g13314 [Tuta absoluta]